MQALTEFHVLRFTTSTTLNIFLKCIIKGSIRSLDSVMLGESACTLSFIALFLFPSN